VSGALRLVIGEWPALGADASRVRTAVFVQEQGIAQEFEWDDWDARSLHCVAYLDGEPIGTGRLLPDAHVGRMAVLAAHRGGGVGARVLNALIDKARALGHARVELSAQRQVVGFYERHGFVARGEPYDEVGIPHQRMELRLGDDAPPAAVAVEVSESEQRMADGTRLHLREWRRGQPGRGVYLLHGLGEHSGRYDALARWFAQRGWRVRAHDHVGHGLSDGARGVVDRPDQMAEHATTLLSEFSSELGAPPLLLGHSMGGALAADLVVARGLPVAGLVLSSPALATRMNAVQRMLSALMLRLAPTAAVGNGLDPQQLSHDEQVVQAYLSDPLVHRRICARLVRWIVDAGERARDRAPGLKVPTLLLVAGADALVDAEGSRALAQRAPAALVTMHWYEGLRHEIFNETPALRARVLSDLEAWMQRRFG